MRQSLSRKRCVLRLSHLSAALTACASVFSVVAKEVSPCESPPFDSPQGGAPTRAHETKTTRGPPLPRAPSPRDPPGQRVADQTAPSGVKALSAVSVACRQAVVIVTAINRLAAARFSCGSRRGRRSHGTARDLPPGGDLFSGRRTPPPRLSSAADRLGSRRGRCRAAADRWPAGGHMQIRSITA